MWASRRKIAGPSGVSYDRMPSKTPVPYWRACAVTWTLASAQGTSSPFIQMNSVFVNGGMLRGRGTVDVKRGTRDDGGKMTLFRPKSDEGIDAGGAAGGE